jgi:AcrR family transcriptional regulator
VTLEVSSRTRRQGKPRASSAGRRDAILAAALALFAERGLIATSIEDIRDASGASVGSIYHHFGSKEGIAVALYAGAMAEYQRRAIAALRGARSAAAGIRGMVAAFLGWVGEHPQLATLMLAVEHSDVRRLADDDVAALNRQFFAERQEWLDRRAATGELKRVPRDVFTSAVFGPAFRFAELWLKGQTSTPLPEAQRVLGELAWSGIRSSRAARR